MNPIKITVLTFGVWVVITIISVFSVEDVSEKPFTIAIYSFYMTPFICLVAFAVSLFFYRYWIENNKKTVIVISTILIVWALCIVFYIKSLFI